MEGEINLKKSYRNLGEFIDELEKQSELVRIKSEVSNDLEITEITDRMSKLPEGGKAILFENVKGSAFPVLTNQFGSMKRISMALGSASLDSLSQRITDIMNMKPPETFSEKIKMLPELLKFGKFLPKNLKGKAPCQEVVFMGEEVDLTKLPVLKCWPDDGGPFVTLPLVFTKGLEDRRRNCGMYRMQIFDRNTTGMHWHIHKDGAHHFHEYRRAGKRMEVAVAIGSDPAVTYSASAPLPRGIDEMLLAGFIRQDRVEMTKCLTVDLEVPAEAEFILEGYVDPDETRIEGPFGDHTGYYSLADNYPVFHVTAITHRKNPVYSATIVGRPPMEDCYMALATERIFLPMLKTVFPEIKDYWLPWEGVFHNIAVVAIEKEFPHHATRVMNGLWGSGQMSFAKMLLLIDDESLLSKPADLMRMMLETIDLDRDVVITTGVLDVLDHSADKPLYGSKLGIDATARISGEEERETESAPKILDEESLIEKIRAVDENVTDASVYFNDLTRRLICVKVKKTRVKNSKFFREKFLRTRALRKQGIYIFFDSDMDLADSSLLLWKAFNNVDPARDISMESERVIIDATRKGKFDGHKREWPDDIVMSEDAVKRVDDMLQKENPGGLFSDAEGK